MSNVLIQKMSNVLIQKVMPGEPFATATELFNAIRRRAYEHFAYGGFLNGRDLDHWLGAERELVWTPPAEVVDEGGQFRLRFGAPGFEPGEIKVSVTADALIVEGERKHRDERKEKGIVFSDYRERTMYRRIPFPEPIDADKVFATLNKGELIVTAQKAAAKAPPKPVAVAAA